MSANFWKRNTYDLANFGKRVLVILPCTSTFTVLIYLTLINTKKKKSNKEKKEELHFPFVISDVEVWNFQFNKYFFVEQYIIYI
jgi:hypothetical protein